LESPIVVLTLGNAEEDTTLIGRSEVGDPGGDGEDDDETTRDTDVPWGGSARDDDAATDDGIQEEGIGGSQ
jgi:hypothetical protein